MSSGLLPNCTRSMKSVCARLPNYTNVDGISTSLQGLPGLTSFASSKGRNVWPGTFRYLAGVLISIYTRKGRISRIPPSCLWGSIDKGCSERGCDWFSMGTEDTSAHVTACIATEIEHNIYTANVAHWTIYLKKLTRHLDQGVRIHDGL